ncbi:unnamed protein product [Brassica oleracea var. botrytis]
MQKSEQRGEGLKLSASESLEDSKKQKKCLKKLLAWKKQKLKLQDEIIAEKEKTKALYYALTQITQDEKKIEEKRGQEQKAKEQALALVEEEQRSKEAAEAHNNGGNKVTCPCRRALVQKRIRIFGATS